MSSGDILLAQSAINLLDRIPASDRARYIDVVIASPFGPVRLAALNLIAAGKSSTDYEPFLWRTVFDRQGSLRSAAVRLLLARGLDVVAQCNAMLGTKQLTSRQVPAALSLLSEQHAPGIVATLTNYVSDPRPAVRAHAVALQAKVLPSLRDEIASRALLDQSRKVRKVGVRLCTSGAFVPLALIKTMLARYGDCRAALAICARDKWDSLASIALIAELHPPCDDGPIDLKQVLRDWIEDPRSLWTKPSGEPHLILSNSEILLRLLGLAGDQAPQLRTRLREAGVDCFGGSPIVE